MTSGLVAKRFNRRLAVKFSRCDGTLSRKFRVPRPFLARPPVQRAGRVKKTSTGGVARGTSGRQPCLPTPSGCKRGPVSSGRRAASERPQFVMKQGNALTCSSPNTGGDRASQFTDRDSARSVQRSGAAALRWFRAQRVRAHSGLHAPLPSWRAFRRCRLHSFRLDPSLTRRFAC